MPNNKIFLTNMQHNDIKSKIFTIFKEVIKLQNKKFRDKNNCFFIEGKKQVEEISTQLV